MLRSVKLNNFKCYKNEKFTFSNLTVFCGNNSVGKSTAIQSLLLAFQNNFSSKLELTGDFIQLGSYQDIHNKSADYDSMSIEIESDAGGISWGYEEKEFDSTMMELAVEAPLPLMHEDTGSLREELKVKYANDFIFLSAERWGPRNNYPYSTQRRSSNWLGIHGEFTPQVLHAIDTHHLLEEGDGRIHSDATSRTLRDSLYAWMGEISPGVFVKPNTIKDADIATNQFQFGEYSYRAVNVGFGLSYALPVVLSLLMAKPGSLVIIENPEAHLHPKGQSYLGRLIALSAQSNIQVIIETHSDHIINGMRLMPRLGLVDPKIFTLYQVSSGIEESAVQEIKINEQGQFSEWPKDFFDQQILDMDILMSGRDQ
jgi:predicted ATPase